MNQYNQLTDQYLKLQDIRKIRKFSHNIHVKTLMKLEDHLNKIFDIGLQFNYTFQLF